jgi:hypothetical protein
MNGSAGGSSTSNSQIEMPQLKLGCWKCGNLKSNWMLSRYRPLMQLFAV